MTDYYINMAGKLGDIEHPEKPYNMGLTAKVGSIVQIKNKYMFGLITDIISKTVKVQIDNQIRVFSIDDLIVIE